MPPSPLTRRTFTRTLAAGAATFAILPGRLRAQSSKGRIKFAVIGC